MSPITQKSEKLITEQTEKPDLESHSRLVALSFSTKMPLFIALT